MTVTGVKTWKRTVNHLKIWSRRIMTVMGGVIVVQSVVENVLIVVASQEVTEI